MIPAFSVEPISGDAHSSPMMDSVSVSLEERRMMLDVVPAALMKLSMPMSTIVGISNGRTTLTYVRTHPAPLTREASSTSAPSWSMTPLKMLVPVVLPAISTTRISAQIVP